jgi:hypothetical protein
MHEGQEDGWDDATERRARGYAQAHEKFLQENHPEMLEAMRAEGTLTDYLQQIGEQAAAMHATILTKMSNSRDLPTDYLKRVEALEAIPATVDELVMADLILQPELK